MGLMSSVLQRYQARILVLTWFAYFSTYLLRKPISVAKTSIATELNLTQTTLGMLDTAFLMPYATAQIFLGKVADKIGARRTLAMGLVGSALSMFTLGNYSELTPIVVLLFLNGLFQSCTWSASVKALAPWFTEETRSTIFGAWSTCQSLGGVAGTYVAVQLMKAGGWRATFFLPSVLVAITGAFQFFFLATPQEVGVISPNQNVARVEMQSAEAQENASKISLWEALRIPTLKNVCFCFFSVKLTRYALLMWLPMYFNKQLNYDIGLAGYLATTFELGGAVGSGLSGVMVDRLFSGAKVKTVAFSQAVSGGCLVAFVLFAPYSVFLAGVLMAAAGAFSCCPDILISGPIATDFGEQDGRNVQGAIAGIINGLGGLGAVLQGIIIGSVADYYGWMGVFYLIIFLSFASTIVLVPAIPIESSRRLML